MRLPDHPRGRGEHSVRKARFRSWSGSSPRTRGALQLVAGGHLRVRIIPADAGSTWRRDTSGQQNGDHPRGRGEHSMSGSSWALVLGSSPRTRGAPSPTLTSRPPSGIIPADAGSTLSRSRPGRRSRDHPRGRGEHYTATLAAQREAGSSPRTRGAPPEMAGPVAQAGIIPADAGSTLGSSSGQ